MIASLEYDRLRDKTGLLSSSSSSLLSSACGDFVGLANTGLGVVLAVFCPWRSSSHATATKKWQKEREGQRQREKRKERQKEGQKEERNRKGDKETDRGTTI